MCSTFKMMAVAAMLERVDRGHDHLERRVRYGRQDLVAYAPVTEKHVGEGSLKLRELCAAATVESDNAAANLIVHALGGPAAVTRFARSIGDRETRLDRIEPELNFAPPGDMRDTTTPAAMARSLRLIVLGNVLAPASRRLLQIWMLGSRTGTTLLRAGLSSTWRVADKSGMGGAHNAHGDSDTRNDLAVLFPPSGAPIVIAAYLNGSRLAAAERDEALASVARFTVAEFLR